MFKLKKLILFICTLLFIIFSFIELIKYLRVDNTLFGVYYLIVDMIIIFLLVPINYNYKKYYSVIRISKLLIVVILGLFNSYILNILIIKNMGYVDDSFEYIKSIYIYKNVLKGIIYFILACFTIFEFKVEKLLIKRNISTKNLD